MIERYKKLLAILAGTSLLTVFVVMLFSSISRYFFNTSILWGEELCKYAMIYGVMFATAICYLDELHIKFSVLSSVKSAKFQKGLEVITDIAVFASALILIWSGYLFVVKRGAIESPGIGISMYYFQSALVVGGVCLLIAASLRLAAHLSALTGRAPCLKRRDV
ncbi:TRAP transporter small permease [Vibrio parahaemolyticus]|uniref:TRAP transporter small permease n=1 Tax=Vibrio natriegens TaxID=691 RepID=UPI0029214B45|nr:TRAP transporter small permease [Vibrio parahaemolyticus]